MSMSDKPVNTAAVERLCWFCEHFSFDPGSPHYSEYTPGSEMQMSCQKDVWDFDSARAHVGYRDEAVLPWCISQAATCKHFKVDKSVVAAVEAASKTGEEKS